MSAIIKEPEHLHTYERSLNNKNTYRCIDPDCSHYHQRQFLVGKRALCPKCKKPFILSYLQLRNKRPVCEFCTKSPTKPVRPEEVKFENIQNEIPDEIKKRLGL